MAEGGAGPSAQDVARAELMELVRQRERAAKYVEDVEQQIYTLEGDFFRDTQRSGNIVQGLNDRYFERSRGTQGRGMKQKKKKYRQNVKQEDRIFSNSSLSSKVACAGLVVDEEEDDEDEEMEEEEEPEMDEEEEMDEDDDDEDEVELVKIVRKKKDKRATSPRKTKGRRDRNAGGQFKASQSDDVEPEELKGRDIEKDKGSSSLVVCDVNERKSGGRGQRGRPKKVNALEVDKTGNYQFFDLASVKQEQVSPNREGDDGNGQNYDLARIKQEPVSPNREGGDGNGRNYGLARIKHEPVSPGGATRDVIGQSFDLARIKQEPASPKGRKAVGNGRNPDLARIKQEPGSPGGSDRYQGFNLKAVKQEPGSPSGVSGDGNGGGDQDFGIVAIKEEPESPVRINPCFNEAAMEEEETVSAVRINPCFNKAALEEKPGSPVRINPCFNMAAIKEEPMD